MKIRLLVTTVMMMGRLMFVHAQGEAEYRLREVGAEEFLEETADIVNQAFSTTQENQASRLYDLISDIVVAEIDFRYSDRQLFSLSFSSLQATTGQLPIYSPQYSGAERWIQAMIYAWLRENPTDLANVYGEIAIPSLNAFVSHRDFDADGEDEYLLYLNSDYHGYIILQHDKSDPIGYQFVSTPLPYGLSMSSHSGRFFEIGFRDINEDNQQEWILLYGSQSCPGCFLTYGDLYVLAWHTNKLENIIPNSRGTNFGYATQSYSFPPEWVNWNFPDNKILKIQDKTDNWGCKWEEVTESEWDDQSKTYSPPTLTRNFADSFECSMRNAESAMWSSNYEAAAQLYEVALSKPTVNTELQQYAKARQVIAYGMSGQHNEAQTNLAYLLSQKPESEMIGAMMDILSAEYETRPPMPYHLCAAVYDLFASYRYLDIGYSVPSNLIMGALFEDIIPPLIRIDPISADRAGCNMSDLVASKTRNEYTFVLSRPPLETMADLGFEVANSFHADLNGDTYDDWLIWLTANINPIFLQSVPELQVYAVSRPSLMMDDDLSQLKILELPDYAGIALAQLINLGKTPELLEQLQYDIPEGSCITDANQLAQSALNIWRIQDGELKQFFEMPVCQPSTFEQLFSNDGYEIYGWGDVNRTNNLTEVTYVWDNSKEEFALPGVVASEPTIRTLHRFNTYDAIWEFEQGDYQKVLDLITSFLDTANSDTSKNEIAAAHYYRALTLEALNRPDEALTEYVAIYTAAPESAWGRLAALHIECVAHC